MAGAKAADKEAEPEATETDVPASNCSTRASRGWKAADTAAEISARLATPVAAGAVTVATTSGIGSVGRAAGWFANGLEDVRPDRETPLRGARGIIIVRVESTMTDSR